jgi:RNA polymerase sigma-70 factor (ECF subfamily)
MCGQAILSDSAIKIMADAKCSRALEVELDSAVEQIVREHARFVFQIAYSVLRNHADAEDAAQEVFVRVLKYKSKLPEVRETKVWLARIAWRVGVHWKTSPWRKQSEQEIDPAILQEMAAMGPGAEHVVANEQMRSLLKKMITALPTELREAIVLSTVQELNSAEIALVLGIPEGSVRTRLMRARNLLKQKLATVMEGHHAR